MNIRIESGKYVVAVSGGVDSVALLDILSTKDNLELIVAHFDHGIRVESAEDRKFVATLSQKYGLAFEYAEGHLGKDASEAVAREKRYDFLRQICKKYQAAAIVTAHHQDDVLETMIINMLRGTHRKGLTALKSHGDIVRPLVGTPKAELIAYAQTQDLKWHDDPTNTDTDYLRNWVRQKVVPKLTENQRNELIDTYEKLSVTNKEIDFLLGGLFQGDCLKKSVVDSLSHDEARELIAAWLRANNVREFDTKTIERVIIGIKTFKPGSIIELKKGAVVNVRQNDAIIQARSVA